MVLASWFEFRRNEAYFINMEFYWNFICQNFSSVHLSQAWHYSHRLYWHEVPTRGFKLHFQWGCGTLWIFCSIRQWTKSLSANTPWGEHVEQIPVNGLKKKLCMQPSLSVIVLKGIRHNWNGLFLKFPFSYL